MLPTLLASQVERTKHVSSSPSFHTLLQWQPPKHHTPTSFQGVHNKMVAKKKTRMNEWCTRYSSNAPLWWQGWLWAHAMESVDRIHSRVTGSNKKRFSFVMMPISSNLHSKFVTWLGFLFQQGTQLVRFVGSDNPETQTRSNTPWRSLEANRLKLFGSCGWASFLNFTVQCHGHWTWHFEFGGASGES